MMLASLPDAARVWLFALDGSAGAVLPAVQAWLPSWASHGRPVTAAAEAVSEHVLAVGAVLSADELNAGVSGCGIDAMRHHVDAAVAGAGQALVPALSILYRDAAGAWQAVPRPVFRRLARAGAIHAQTLVVDVTADTVGGLRAHGAVRPAADAWTGRAFGLALTA